jgi:hypothetical protein
MPLLLDNVEKNCTGGHAQITIWRMRIACLRLDTHTHTQNMYYL